MYGREVHREMILHPLRWPQLALPLKRRNPFDAGNTAVFFPGMTDEIQPNEPIEIRIGTLFDKLSELPVVRYQDVDALLDDDWVVD